MRGFLLKQLVITKDVDVELYGHHLIGDSSSAAYTLTAEAKNKIEAYIQEAAISVLLRNSPDWNVAPGDKGSSPKSFITVKWECTGRGRRRTAPKM